MSAYLLCDIHNINGHVCNHPYKLINYYVQQYPYTVCETTAILLFNYFFHNESQR